MNIKVKERGWAGHFCCAHRCKYRRNTLVSDGTRHIIVSSVGNMTINTDINEIGHRKYYETMVFRGIKEGPYIEAGVSLELTVSDDLKMGIYSDSYDDLPADVDNIMDDQHDAIVEWVKNNFDKCYKENKNGTLYN